MKGIVGIILMGGEGLRFGSTLPKQFHFLSGKKVYQHTLERFIDSGFFEKIILVTHREWLKEVSSEILSYPQELIEVIPAGKTRQESSFQGILACPANTKVVVIHDAVRPFISKEIIKKNIESALEFGAADTCIPSSDTIVYSPSGMLIDTIPPRSSFFRGQTPQSFAYPLILDAHHKTSQVNASDDCSLVLEFGNTIHMVQGDERNIKITTELDLFLADQLFRLDIVHLQATQKTLKGKKYVITGGTGGIGSALVSLLEKEEAIPLIISRSSKHFSYDLSSYENIAKAFTAVHNEHGPVDGLINCIGLLKIKEIDALTAEEIEELIQINLSSPIYCCKLVELKEKGHLVNVGSSSYARGRKNYAVYSSTKAALVNFTQGLAEEKLSLNINAIVPGRTNTKMRKENFPDEDNEQLLQPEKVASVIIDLLKQDSLTGSIIRV